MKNTLDVLINWDKLSRLKKNASNLCLLDCSMSKTAANLSDNRQSGILPGAQLFPFDTLFPSPKNLAPNALPNAEFFSKVVSQFGISNDTLVILCDTQNNYASPRVWWMFRVMGHQYVYVLDRDSKTAGGEDEERLVLMGGKDVGSSDSTKYSASIQSDLLANKELVLDKIHCEHTTIIDARSNGRFMGVEPEPRAGLVSGHIPGAINIPYQSVLSPAGFRPPADIEKIFQKAGVCKSNKLIYMCGSGVTACIVALAGVICGYTNFAIYDGSWSEWASMEGVPKI